MSKRSYALLTVLVLASMLLAACAPGGGGGAAAKPVIKIASQSPLSGGQSVLGVDIKNGAELAVEQLGGPLRDMGFDV